MKPREVKVLTEKRLLDAAEVCMYLGLGRNKGIEFAKSIGAEAEKLVGAVYMTRLL